MAFPPVMTFTVAMLAATLLHWDRFDIHHLPFQLWLVLYIITPFLITWLWWTNRRTDPVAPEPGDPLLPRGANFAFGALGVVTLLAALAGFVRPQLAVGAWSWCLTTLTGRGAARSLASNGVGARVRAAGRAR